MVGGVGAAQACMGKGAGRDAGRDADLHEEGCRFARGGMQGGMQAHTGGR